VPYDSGISGVSNLPTDHAAAGDEGQIIAAAQDGDRVALETLLRSHYDRCYAVCRRLLGNDQDALDATQETMIGIARGISRFDGRSAFSTWVYRVATNRALDELRRRGRRPPIEHVLSSTELANPLEDLAASPLTDEVGDTATARLSLDAALEQITVAQRSAVVLRDVFDLDYAEIAEVLRVPIGTVRSRIARGRAALADVLEPRPAPASRGGSVTGSQRNPSRPPSVEAGDP
jgi:RNA polymerase sigma-70 factor (ECF subfamily)